MIDLKKYFDRIYCINLDRRPDRYEKVLTEFSKFNIINVERFSGIDGGLIKNDSSLLNGELGILETHYSIIKKVKEDSLNSVLIMEDDVYFTDEINNVDEYMKVVPDDWDFIYFGGNHVYGQPPKRINSKILKLNFTVALHCVAIKLTVFDEIIELLPKHDIQVDGCYGKLQKKYNGYAFYPNMAKQRSGFSDIQNRNVNYDIYFNG